MQKDKNKNDNRDIKSMLIIIFAVVVITITGTFAWLTYRSNDTAMVLTIGDVEGLTVSLKPYQINGSITPTNSYTNGNMISITADNKNIVSDGFTLFYKINSIDSALRNAYFKYTLTKSTNNGSSWSTVKTGNFSTATSNSELTINTDTIPAGQKYLYRVYLWIDTSGGNQSSMQGKIFDGELRATITH